MSLFKLSLKNGNSAIVDAPDLDTVVAYAALYSGLANIDDVYAATVDDVAHHQSVGGKVVKATAKDRERVLQTLNAETK